MDAQKRIQFHLHAKLPSIRPKGMYYFAINDKNLLIWTQKKTIVFAYMSKVVIPYFGSSFCHSYAVFICWADKKMITNCFSYLILILIPIIIFPSGILVCWAKIKEKKGMNKRRKKTTFLNGALSILIWAVRGIYSGIHARIQNTHFEGHVCGTILQGKKMRKRKAINFENTRGLLVFLLGMYSLKEEEEKR